MCTKLFKKRALHMSKKAILLHGSDSPHVGNNGLGNHEPHPYIPDLAFGDLHVLGQLKVY